MNEEYLKRIQRVLTYIEENLATPLSLETVSEVACYSPFHLHRLFKAITNETVNGYIVRKRIEKAAIQLVHRKEVVVSELAFALGFNSHSSFTRSFRKMYGCSPAEFRKSNQGNFSKIGKTESKMGQVSYLTEAYVCTIQQFIDWVRMQATIEIKEIPQQQIAYVTHIGSEGVEQAFGRLLRWAVPMGLFPNHQAKLVRVFHDSFKVTDADKVRMSIGLQVTGEVKAGGEVAITTLPAGKAIVGRFEIEPKDFEKSWSGLFLWMSEKEYQMANRLPFEIYHNNPEEHPEKKCVVDLCIPV